MDTSNSSNNSNFHGNPLHIAQQRQSYSELKERANKYFKDQQFKQARLIYTHLLTLLEKEILYGWINYNENNQSRQKELSNPYNNDQRAYCILNDSLKILDNIVQDILVKDAQNGVFEDLILVKLSIIHNNRSKVYLNLGHFSLAVVDAKLALEHLIDLEKICNQNVESNTKYETNTNIPITNEVNTLHGLHLDKSLLSSYTFLLQKSKALFSVAKSYFMLKYFDQASEFITQALDILKEMEKKFNNPSINLNMNLSLKLFYSIQKAKSQFDTKLDETNQTETINQKEEIIETSINDKNILSTTNNSQIHLDYKFIPYVRTHRYQFTSLHIQTLNLNPDSPLQIRDSDTLDREIYATRNIKENEIIHKEYASIVSSISKSICEQCGTTISNNSNLSSYSNKLDSISFCSQSCEDKSVIWSTKDLHLKWDKLISKFKLFDDCIPLMIAKVIGEKLVYIEKLTPQQLDKIVDLRDQQLDLTHLLSQVFPNQVPKANLDYLMNIYFYIREILHLKYRPSSDFEWFLAQYYTIACNACYGKSNENDLLKDLVLLFTGFTSFFNHSSEANAAAFMFKNCILFQAKKDISVGEAVTIEYTDRLFIKNFE